MSGNMTDKKKYTFDEMANWVLDNWRGLLPILQEVKRQEEEREKRMKRFIEMAKKYKARHKLNKHD